MSQTNLVKNPLPTELGSVVFCTIKDVPHIAIAWTPGPYPDWRLSNGAFYTHAKFSNIVESWTVISVENVAKWRGAYKRIKALRKIMRKPFPKNGFYINGMPTQYDALADLYDQKLADQLRGQIEP